MCIGENLCISKLRKFHILILSVWRPARAWRDLFRSQCLLSAGSPYQILLCFFLQLGSFFRFDDQKAVLIAHQISPGQMTCPQTDTGTLISPGPFLYGPFGVTPFAYTGKFSKVEISSMSRMQPSMTNPARPAFHGGVAHDLSAKGAVHASAGCDYQYVSRLCQLQSFVEHQIVTFREAHSEGGSQKRGMIHGFQAAVAAGDRPMQSSIFATGSPRNPSRRLLSGG